MGFLSAHELMSTDSSTASMFGLRPRSYCCDIVHVANVRDGTRGRHFRERKRRDLKVPFYPHSVFLRLTNGTVEFRFL